METDDRFTHKIGLSDRKKQEPENVLADAIANLEKDAGRGQLVTLLMEIKRDPIRLSRLDYGFNLVGIGLNIFQYVDTEKVPEVRKLLQEFLHIKNSPDKKAPEIEQLEYAKAKEIGILLNS